MNAYIFSTAVSENTPFTNFQAAEYASSTWYQYLDPEDAAFGYMLGEPYLKNIYGGYVWPVRTAQSGKIQLPKTGQTKCYSNTTGEIDCAGTGQDGETQIGVGWTETRTYGPCDADRFLSNASGTISDNMTGLEWSPANIIASRDPGWDQDDTPADGKVTWQHALDYIQKLNIEQYLGYSDWRLPNKLELESAISYSNFTPPCGRLWGVSPLLLWSSTTIPENKTLAYCMNMAFYATENMFSFVHEKRLPNAGVMAVRGGVLGDTSGGDGGDNGTDGGDCQLRVFPKTIHKILSKLKPTKLFLLIAKGSTLSDDDAIWDTSSIMSTNSHRISTRIRLVFTVINPFDLDVNEVKVAVGGCSGTVKVKAF